MSTITCLVCYEFVGNGQRLPLGPLTDGNGNALRTQDCGHLVCRSCMGLHVKARVDQMITALRCPGEGCKTRIVEKDLEALRETEHLEAEVLNRFAELSRREYTNRAEEMIPALESTDIATLETMWSTMRRCPRCQIILVKSEGCNSFYCVCGHHFDYGSAPRAIGNDTPNFWGMINLAKRLNLPLRTAIKYGSWDSFFKSGRIAESLGISIEEACDLYKKAIAGDTEARAEIRRGRELQRAAAEEAEQTAVDDAKHHPKSVSKASKNEEEGEQSEADTAESDPGHFLSEDSNVCELTW